MIELVRFLLSILAALSAPVAPDPAPTPPPAPVIEHAAEVAPVAVVECDNFETGAAEIEARGGSCPPPERTVRCYNPDGSIITTFGDRGQWTNLPDNCEVSES